MTVWQWLTNGWALTHLVSMVAIIGLFRVLDIRYKRTWKGKGD